MIESSYSLEEGGYKPMRFWELQEEVRSVGVGLDSSLLCLSDELATMLAVLGAGVEKMYGGLSVTAEGTQLGLGIFWP